MKPNVKQLFLIYISGVLLNFLILVLDNFFFNVYEGTIIQNSVWIFTTILDDPLDLITIFSIAFLLFLPFRKKLGKTQTYAFGLLYTYAVLGLNIILFETFPTPLEGLIRIWLAPPDWLVLIMGTFLIPKLLNILRTKIRV